MFGFPSCLFSPYSLRASISANYMWGAFANNGGVGQKKRHYKVALKMEVYHPKFSIWI
jgi:hypothetical protein